MALKQNFELMAHYNQWMNDKLYNAAASLDEAALREDVGAFFISLLGTLNHILVAEILWLKRFRQHPANYTSLDPVLELPQPAALDRLLYSEFDQLRIARSKMDGIIVAFCEQAGDADFEHCFAYTDRKGEPFRKTFGFLVHHFFNHQTHHRGQATTLLSQRGIDIGVTDLAVFAPDQA